MRKPFALALPIVLLAGVHASAFAAPSDVRVERAAPDRVTVTWVDQAPVDVYLAARPDASLAQAKLISDDNRAGRLEVPADPAVRPYFLLKDERDRAVVRAAERVLPLQQGSNFRDIGGYPAAGGKHVRWGKIYRSGGTPLLTEADVARVRGLGLSDMIDLRSSEERSLAPSRIEGVRYSAVGYSMSRVMDDKTPITGDDRIRAVYRGFPSLLAPQLKIVFRALLAGDGAVAYNCSAGQDRTGFATAMVLSALGVPRDVILADYHLSTTYRRPEYEMPKLEPAVTAGNPVAAFFARFQGDPAYRTPKPLYDSQQRPLLTFAFDEVEARWGSVDAYLAKEVGVGPAEIARLRALYLE